MRIYLTRRSPTAMGGGKVMLELLDALAEAWSAVEQELWGLSHCRLRKTGKAQDQQKNGGRPCCTTAKWTAKEHVWVGHQREPQLLNLKRGRRKQRVQERESASPSRVTTAFSSPP